MQLKVLDNDNYGLPCVCPAIATESFEVIQNFSRYRARAPCRLLCQDKFVLQDLKEANEIFTQLVHLRALRIIQTNCRVIFQTAILLRVAWLHN